MWRKKLQLPPVSPIHIATAWTYLVWFSGNMRAHSTLYIDPCVYAVSDSASIMEIFEEGRQRDLVGTHRWCCPQRQLHALSSCRRLRLRSVHRVNNIVRGIPACFVMEAVQFCVRFRVRACVRTCVCVTCRCVSCQRVLKLTHHNVYMYRPTIPTRGGIDLRVE